MVMVYIKILCYHFSDDDADIQLHAPLGRDIHYSSQWFLDYSSQSRISRVKTPLAMGLFDNILGQGKGKAGDSNLAIVFSSSSNIALIIIQFLRRPLLPLKKHLRLLLRTRLLSIMLILICKDRKDIVGPYRMTMVLFWYDRQLCKQVDTQMHSFQD